MKENDPRREAASLTEVQFVGAYEPHAANEGDGLLDLYRDPSFWDKLPEHPLLRPQDGYSLLYRAAEADGAPRVFLIDASKELAGFYCDSVLYVDRPHRRKYLDCELILAAFAQAGAERWQARIRKMTPSGLKSFKRAYKYVRDIAPSASANGGR